MKKISLFIITVILVSGLLSTECLAVSGFTRTPLRGQERDYWCWCAGNQMLLETQGRYFTQTQISGGIYAGATLQTQYNRLSACASDIQWDMHSVPYAFEQVKRTINLGWAISCQCLSSSGGHIMVITGYDDNPAGFDNIWLQDPWGNSTSPHTGVEGWCNYAAPIYGNYAGTVFAQFQNYVWNGTIV